MGLSFKIYALFRIQRVPVFWDRQIKTFDEGRSSLGLRRLKLVTKQLQTISKSSVNRVAVPLHTFSIVCIVILMGLSFHTKFLLGSRSENVLSLLFVIVYAQTSLMQIYANVLYSDKLHSHHITIVYNSN